MVARIHFDFERTVAKFRLAEKLQSRELTPADPGSGDPLAGAGAARPRKELPPSDARTVLDGIEQRLSRRNFI